MPCNLIESMGKLSALINLPLTYNSYRTPNIAHTPRCVSFSFESFNCTFFNYKLCKKGAIVGGGGVVGCRFVYTIALFN